MTILTVLHFPDPQLRKKAAPITLVDGAVRRLAANMLETMYAEKGIGLAATQVNVQQRLIVIDVSAQRDAPLALINPEVIHREGSEQMEEGCLSVPGFYETVQRAEYIGYRYLNLQGEPVQAETGGLLAVCIQHEIDHLDGKLFIDYLSPLKRQRLRKKIEKQERAHSPIL